MAATALEAMLIFRSHAIELLPEDATQYASEANQTLDPIGSLHEFATQLRTEWLLLHEDF